MSLPIAEPYIKAFEQLGFGLFIHWGLYSQLGRGEWVFSVEQMDMCDYEPLADTFTATEFDARKIAKMAYDAGCRYVTITARHHDGFSLYDTRGLSDFDVMHSAAKRDLMTEFVDACREFGLVPFFYHTTLDWHHPDFDRDFPAYLDYLQKSVEILCTHYGKIGGFWFDGNWSKPDEDWREDALYEMIRKHQPEAVIINNTGVHARGERGNPYIDVVTFEQGRPDPLDREGMDKYLAAEMCDTISEIWGYGERDFNYKSPMELIESLCMCRKAGANLLMNIGPMGQGGVTKMQEALLELIGQWMKLYGEAVYNGRPCGVRGIGKNFALCGGDVMYFFCFDVAKVGDLNANYEGWYAFGGMKKRVKSIRWMDGGEARFHQAEELLALYVDKYPYGSLCCVRVAKAELE